MDELEFPFLYEGKHYTVKKHNVQDTKIIWRIYNDKKVLRRNVAIPIRYDTNKIINALCTELSKMNRK